MDEPDSADGYVAPPAFAPPAWRVAPLNEFQVLGSTSYPNDYPRTAPPPYPPDSWPPAAFPASAPTRRTPRRLTAAVTATVIAALVVITVALISSGTGTAGRKLTVPESAGAYNRVSTISGSQLHSLFTGGGSVFGNLATQDLDNAKVGVYARTSQTTPSMLFIGFDAADSPVIGHQLRSEDPGDVAGDVILSAGSSDPPLDVDAGPLGGALKCGHVNVDGDDGTVGVWADPDTLGIVLVLDPTHRPGTAETGAITRAVRAGAEH